MGEKSTNKIYVGKHEGKKLSEDLGVDWGNITHPNLAEVEERVELCHYPPLLCAFTAVYRVNFTFKSKV